MVHGAAQRTAGGCRYQELIQRQAGSQVTINQQIALPGSITALQGGPMQSGPDAAALHQALTQDMTATLEYAC